MRASRPQATVTSADRALQTRATQGRPVERHRQAGMAAHGVSTLCRSGTTSCS